MRAEAESHKRRLLHALERSSNGYSLYCIHNVLLLEDDSHIHVNTNLQHPPPQPVTRPVAASSTVLVDVRVLFRIFYIILQVCLEMGGIYLVSSLFRARRQSIGTGILTRNRFVTFYIFLLLHFIFNIMFRTFLVVNFL